MSKSAIYAVNTTVGTAIAANGTLPLTTIVRRFGGNVDLINGAFVLTGCGYYDISSVVTVTATAAGEVTASLYLDGVEIPGATATATAAVGDEVTLPLSAIVRLTGCDDSVLTIVIGQSVTTFNASAEVVKL